jgi:hypothetical protein
VKVQNLGSIRRDVKKARQSYVDTAVQGRLEGLGLNISARDWDAAKRAARREWEDAFPALAALLEPLRVPAITPKEGQ